jgi:hypothetical protein
MMARHITIELAVDSIKVEYDWLDEEADEFVKQLEEIATAFKGDLEWIRGFKRDLEWIRGEPITEPSYLTGPGKKYDQIAGAAERLLRLLFWEPPDGIGYQGRDALIYQDRDAWPPSMFHDIEKCLLPLVRLQHNKPGNITSATERCDVVLKLALTAVRRVFTERVGQPPDITGQPFLAVAEAVMAVIDPDGTPKTRHGLKGLVSNLFEVSD